MTTSTPRNYMEQPVAGVTWRRCNAVYINNGYGETPGIQFCEEDITTLTNGGTMRTGAMGVAALFDPEAVIELLDPATDEPLGATMTQGQVQLALYSLYRQLTKARDGG